MAASDPTTNPAFDPPTRERFETAYTGQPPWEISKPQDAFTNRADRVTGSVLDCGCGTGENTLFFATRGLHAMGIDFLANPIARAKNKAINRNIPATFQMRDALTLAEMPDRFDSVLDSGLFHIFTDADRHKYVEGLHAVLNPGGRLFLLCFSDAEPGTIGPRRVTKKELEESFAKDWTIESIEPERFEVRTDLKEVSFSAGGAHAWFMIARRGN